jgi:cytochrome b561
MNKITALNLLSLIICVSAIEIHWIFQVIACFNFAMILIMEGENGRKENVRKNNY